MTNDERQRSDAACRSRSHVPIAASAVLAVAATVMAVLARRQTRCCFERFDEGVGRPHRAGGPTAKTGRGPADRGAAVAEPPRTLPAAGVK
jgi:hypothetical protein